MWIVIQDQAGKQLQPLPFVFYERYQALIKARECAGAFENTGTFFKVAKVDFDA